MPKKLTVTWQKCKNEGDRVSHWCKLMNLELPLNREVDGVYVIWRGGDDGAVIDVGQGNISQRLGVHRKDKDIAQLHNDGVPVYATWAEVPESSLDGVESFLADHYGLRGGRRRYPDADPIEVNLPGK